MTTIHAAKGVAGLTRARSASLGRALIAIVIFLLAAHAGFAQEPAGQPAASTPSASELAKQTQNPIASLISVPFEGNWDMGVGEREGTNTILNFQPVIPFPISKSTNVVLRIITPLISQASSSAGGSGTSGIGDILLSSFVSPSRPSRVSWGIGPVFLLPTATNSRLGAEKFGIGPTAVVLTQPGNWTFGLLANQIWSVSGAKDRDDVNNAYVQPFTSYNLGSGLAVDFGAELTGKWNAESDKWSGPLLLGVSKVTKLGSRPVKLKVAAGPTIGPEEGPDWRFRFAMTFLFPR